MLRWMPENVSTFGGEIDGLFSLITIVVGVWFVLTYAAIIYALFRYRRSRNPRASYLPADRVGQYGWILGLAVVVLLIDIALDHHGIPVWDKIKTDIPPGDVQVRVTAKQFNWEVKYPGPDGKFDTADDAQMDGELHVPVDKVVHVTLTSKDVIHSFFLPNLRLKQDAMPGRNIPVWFQATKAGEYVWPCAELCGFGHTGMQGKLFVHNVEDYEAWQKKKWPAPPAPAPQPETPTIAPPRVDPPKIELPKQEEIKPEPPKQEETKQELPKQDDMKPEPAKQDDMKPEPAKQDDMKPEPSKQDEPKPDTRQTEEKKEG